MYLLANSNAEKIDTLEITICTYILTLKKQRKGVNAGGGWSLYIWIGHGTLPGGAYYEYV